MAKFSIFYPTNPARTNQPFGVNGAYYQANGINVLGHNGIDMFCYHGQPIYAAHDGTAYYQTDNKAGQGVIIVSDKAYDYKNQQAWYKTIYWHLCDPHAEPKYASPVFIASGNRAGQNIGVPVKAGDIIGFGDSTGLSSGDHLHFGLKPVVPGTGLSYGDAADVGVGNWVNVDQNNGYSGAIDPTPYWSGNYAVDAVKVLETQTKTINIMVKMVELLTKLVSLIK